MHSPDGTNQIPIQNPAPAFVAKPKKRYLPMENSNYVQMLRSPQFKAWKPFASAGIFIGYMALIFFVVIIAYIIFLLIAGLESSFADNITQQTISALGIIDFTVGNLTLASFIPAAMLSTWVIYRIKPGYVSSVAGRFRWKWFGWCLLAIVPLWSVLFAILIGLDIAMGSDISIFPIENPGLVFTFILMIFLTTPLQAAGEEYLFRGWLIQNISSFFNERLLGVFISGLVSTTIFAGLHLELNPVALILYFSLSIAALTMTYKTGGIEAACTVHIVHNVFVFHTMLFINDGIERSLTIELGAMLIYALAEIVFFSIATGAIILLAKYKKLQSIYIPNEQEAAQHKKETQDYEQYIYHLQYQSYLNQLEYHQQMQEYRRQYHEWYYQNYPRQ